MGWVLVVDAEDAMRTALARGLRAEGLDVVTAGDGPGGLREGLTSTFDVIVLDVGLPGLSGYQVLRRLRADGIDTPVLLISGNDAQTAQAQGFDWGDGYVVKPFSLLVLVAQVRALLRRQDALCSGGPPRVRAGELVLDVATKNATWMQRPVQFSPREFAVLRALVSRRGAVVSKPELQRMAWGDEVAVTPNAVEVYIGYVRRKLAAVGAAGVVRTVRGHGYRVALPDASPDPSRCEQAVATHRSVVCPSGW